MTRLLIKTLNLKQRSLRKQPYRIDNHLEDKTSH